MIKEKQKLFIIIKKHKAIIILSAIFILCFSLQCAVTQGLKSFVPEAVVFKYRTSANIPPLALENVDNSSAITQKSGFIVSGVNSCSAQLMLTNSNYGKISGMTFTDGAYFKLTDESLKNRFAVIGENLSVQLFKSNKAVGQRIIINDIPFTVCGVYKQDKNIFKNMSYGIDSVVYLPIISDFNTEPTIIDQVVTLSKAEIVASTVSTMQLQLLQPFSYDYAINLSSVRHMASQSINLSLFICGFIVIIWLITKGCIEIKAKSYHNKKTLLITIGIFLLALILFILVKFKLYIPFSWFPEDNIFDFESYLAQLTYVFQNRNTYSNSLDIFWNYSFTVLPICFTIGIASIVSFVPLFIKLTTHLNRILAKLKSNSDDLI